MKVVHIDLVPKEQPDPELLRISKLFLSVLYRHNLIRRVPKNIDKTIQQIGILVNETSLHAVEDLIHWYDANLHTSYLPLVYTAEGFSREFTTLERMRSQEESPKNYSIIKDEQEDFQPDPVPDHIVKINADDWIPTKEITGDDNDC